MLPYEAVENFRRLIAPAYQERDTQLEREFGQVQSDFNKRGMLRSGPACQAIVKVAIAELAIRSAMAHQALMRTAEAYQVPLTEQFRSDAHELLGDHIKATALAIKASAASTQPLPKYDDVAARILPLIDDEAKRSHEKWMAEVDLVVVRAARQKVTEPMSNAFHVAGSVGVIQVGSGNYAIATQNIDARSVLNLVEGLAQLREELLKLPDGAADVPKQELIEAIDTGTSELQKPKPNLTLVRGVLGGVGQTLSTVASLKPAYDSLKGMLALMGVNLP